jgi:adenylate kinase
LFYIFYGPEGSGKTTQARLLAEHLKLPLLISGDLVREAVKKDKGLIGKACRQALFTGHYVPSSEMFVLWKKRLKKPDVQQGWVMDGFPRNLTQVDFLERKLDKYGHQITKVFYLEVSEKESLKRLLKRKRRLDSGELHDSPERIRGRLKEYKKSNKLILKYYQKLGLLKIIDGERPIKTIFKDILKFLNYQKKKK